MSQVNNNYHMDKEFKILSNLPLNHIAILEPLNSLEVSNLKGSPYSILAEYIILQHFGASDQTPSKHKLDTIKSSVGYRLYSALAFIYHNIKNKITIDDIASEAAISKFHLIRCFKDRFGVTPIQLHLLLKVNGAKEMLLKHPKTKIKEIASIFGYPDIYTFSKH